MGWVVEWEFVGELKGFREYLGWVRGWEGVREEMGGVGGRVGVRKYVEDER